MTTPQTVIDYLNSLDENAEMIYIYYKSLTITILPDLFRFKNLKILICSFDKIVNLDNIPVRLEILDCNNNQITKISQLPKSLKELNCSSNKIKELNLPEGLEILDCAYNQIIKLENLPE